MKLKFLGAARTVTGSKYLLEAEGRRVLVDCGLFQGQKELRLRNRNRFPIDPKSIDAVVLTHAHIDHSGYVPLLVKSGFNGPVYCTDATLALCKILLPDSGRLQEEEARYANKRGYAKHSPALPLYTQEEAERSLRSFISKPFREDFEVAPGIKVRFHNSGHILGSAFVTLSAEGKSILFSGDVGRSADPILLPPETGLGADYVVVESTYGDRVHDLTSPEKQLGEIVRRAVDRRGVVLIPAFSVGRSQTLLYYLERLVRAGQIPDVPIYLNSPMSINASGVYCDFRDQHRLSPEDCEALCGIATYVRSPEESKRLNEKRGPMVIISANGMATGGRILHHLKAFAPHEANIILLVGYQSAGTRGASLAQGARMLKIHGEQVPVRAEVQNLHNLSAHADSKEILEWLKGHVHTPRRVFVTHGEERAAYAFQGRIQEELGWDASVPGHLDEVQL